MFKFLNVVKSQGTKIKCVRNACRYNAKGLCVKNKVNFDYGKGIGFVCKDFDFK